MAKTDVERQAEWRQRLLLRSSFFTDAEERRLAGLSGDLTTDERPEAQAVVRFFKAYPRCFHLPESVGLDSPPDRSPWLTVCLPYYEHTRIEAAAAIVALSEISSLYVQVQCVGDGKSGMYSADSLPAEVVQVREEIADMRRLGLWGR